MSLYARRTVDEWRGLVEGATHGCTLQQIDDIAAHAYATQEMGAQASVWHSLAQVLKTPCHCFACEPIRS